MGLAVRAVPGVGFWPRLCFGLIFGFGFGFELNPFGFTGFTERARPDLCRKVQREDIVIVSFEVRTRVMTRRVVEGKLSTALKYHLFLGRPNYSPCISCNAPAEDVEAYIVGVRLGVGVSKNAA